MLTLSKIAVLSSALLPVASAISGKTFTGWDCCKPACAWTATVPQGTSGTAHVCDINNNILGNGPLAKSGCDSGGTGYLCDSYAPVPVSNNLSYGFAVMMASNDCCKCYQLTWTSGQAAGKQMIVQAINIGSPSGNVGSNDIVILTPGGGVGPNSAGCRNQYGTSWGQQNGGVGDRSACANLPANLQGGCYWRFNWANGDLNNWNIDYQQVSCPGRLTSISGCSG
ncbi:hypothetical protein Sste5346_003660 [Sporothrix stenoceras]|uniref:cellulase n=1 Tax=Sporothrix stenoceras TaxID=5173 RepID=A0ABR3ZC43_9PEZI